MQRIPEGRGGGGGRGRRQPVLLQHGVLVDGMTWLLNSPEESLGFILAGRGFDVWIANSRGTRWSWGHVSLDSSDSAYWQWSWDELVAYDLPAIFDFVYQQTGQKLDYVGRSMRTLIALAYVFEGRLIDKLRSAASLSPVAYLTHMTTPIGILAAKAFIGEITTGLGIAEFNPKGMPVTNFLKTLCKNPGIGCYDLMTSFIGKNYCLNESTVEVFLKYEPQSTSTRNMVHLAQTFRDGSVSKYDYERKYMNMRYYGQTKAPVYKMSSIHVDVPMLLSYGGRDDSGDVELLLDSLKFHSPLRPRRLHHRRLRQGFRLRCYHPILQH
ncbi:Triacylglycerol lipase 2 [Acorus gramineus]|uniref:Triacylglycerol lipase 2 n=1 Tax=Acorus gramineus TaxID=55184 RepID=A0AAV9B7K6_ACOGR|nr:Triacylglycerol lipase 2 [Acorus gramineus]